MEVVMTRHARRRCVVRRVPHGVAGAVRDAILTILPSGGSSIMQGALLKLFLQGAHMGFRTVCILELNRVIVVTVYRRKNRRSA